METKECSKCKRQLSLSCFNKCKRNKDGLQYQCKECQGDSSKESYHKRRKMEFLRKENLKYNIIEIERATICECVKNVSFDTMQQYADIIGVSLKMLYRKIEQHNLRELFQHTDFSVECMEASKNGTCLTRIKTINDYSDKELLEELKRRCFVGNIEKITKKKYCL